MKRSWRYVPFLLVLVLLAFLGRGLFMEARGYSDARLGATIASVSLPVLGQHTAFRLPQDMGKPLALLHVWATWCGACRAEAAAWAALVDQVPASVLRVGILYKDKGDEATLWLGRYGNPYELILLDQRGDLAMELGVYGTPETYLLDQSGRILAKHIGRMSDELWQGEWLPKMQKGSA